MVTEEVRFGRFQLRIPVPVWSNCSYQHNRKTGIAGKGRLPMPDAQQNNFEGEVHQPDQIPLVHLDHISSVEPDRIPLVHLDHIPAVEPDRVPSAAEPSKPASRAGLYAAAAAGFGILAGGGVAAFLFHQSEASVAPAPAPSSVSNQVQDLGSAVAENYGLKGHLTAQWTSQLGYHVSIEPSDPAMAAGFALAISNPSHPLSMKVQFEDRLGFVVCSQDVLVKFQPRKPADLEPPDPKTASGKKPRKITAIQQKHLADEQADYDRAQAQERQREKGNDVFQNQVGADGHIASLSAQGSIPCPTEAYARAAKWGFVPDFPTLDDQNELVGNQPQAREIALRNAMQKARRRMAYKSPGNALAFSLEGDDAVVDFDTAGGVLETRAGKTFTIDKSAGEGNTAVWQQYPAYFHYRCEQTTSSCTLARAGAGVMHATLKR
jgi:hypothetical protein